MESVAHPKLRVLMVEDEEDTASLLRFLLERASYQVIHAKDGRQAQRYRDDGRAEIGFIFILMQGEFRANGVAVNQAGIRSEVRIISGNGSLVAESLKNRRHRGPRLAGRGIVPDDRPAIIARCEGQTPVEVSWQQLQRDVGALAASLRGLGIGPGDRVVAYLPNVPQTVVADAGTGKLNISTTLTFDAVGNPTQVNGPRPDVTGTVTTAYDGERRSSRATAGLRP